MLPPINWCTCPYGPPPRTPGRLAQGASRNPAVRALTGLSRRPSPHSVGEGNSYSHLLCYKPRHKIKHMSIVQESKWATDDGPACTEYKQHVSRARTSKHIATYPPNIYTYIHNRRISLLPPLRLFFLSLSFLLSYPANAAFTMNPFNHTTASIVTPFNHTTTKKHPPAQDKTLSIFPMPKKGQHVIITPLTHHHFCPTTHSHPKQQL